MASASGYLERRRILTGSSELRRSLPLSPATLAPATRPWTAAVPDATLSRQKRTTEQLRHYLARTTLHHLRRVPSSRGCAPGLL